MSLSDQVSGKWFLLLNQVCEYAGQLLKDAAGQEVYLGGTTQLLKFPEYRDADKARDLMTFMVDNKQNLPVPLGNAPGADPHRAGECGCRSEGEQRGHCQL